MARTHNPIVKEALGRGWVIERQTKHIIMRFPANGRMMSVAGSPSDQRAEKNQRAWMRRLERET